MIYPATRLTVKLRGFPSPPHDGFGIQAQFIYTFIVFKKFILSQGTLILFLIYQNACMGRKKKGDEIIHPP